MIDDNTREIKIIEAYYKGALVGKFVDMHHMRAVLGDLADKVSYQFAKIDEKRHEKLFWTLIRRGYDVLEKKEQKTR